MGNHLEMFSDTVQLSLLAVKTCEAFSEKTPPAQSESWFCGFFKTVNPRSRRNRERQGLVW